MSPARPTVAVIGSGVSGLTAAYLLQRRYDVTLFEADERIGGHCHTHDVPAAGGRFIPIDSGFIVHNERTYPHLLRLFADLHVATKDSEMSMSIRCDGCGLEYAGARGVRGLFATPTVAFRGRYLRLLAEVKKFHRQARRLLGTGECEGISLGEFLTQGGYSRYFASHFLLPYVSAVWSAGMGDARCYPARYLFRFFEQHGALSVTGSPQWKTVVGGSRSYVSQAAKNLTAVLVSTPVHALRRTGDGIQIRDDADQVSRFDKAVIATHADQALALLADPTPTESDVLGAIRYSQNSAVLHTDERVLPHRAAAHASWNYRLDSCEPAHAPVQLSYDMNRLHQIDEPVNYVVTLNDTGSIDPARVIERMTYQHPIYTAESLAAQCRLPALANSHICYAGAYHGWGFHEDGCVSGARAAQHFGVGW